MCRLIQDNGAQRTLSAFFKKNRFLDLMIINFENASSHNMLCKTLIVCYWLNQKGPGIHTKYTKSVLKIPVANFRHLIIP